MKIYVKEANDTGSGYPFTIRRWLAGEVAGLAGDSKAFEREFGRDWALVIVLLTNTRLKKPRVYRADVSWEKHVCEIVMVPYIGSEWAEPAAYLEPLRQWLEGIAAVLRKYHFDSKAFEKRIPGLLKEFRGDPSRIVSDWVESPKTKPGKIPKWEVPKDLKKRIEAADGIWEDERFDPLLLSVSTGTTYGGREIPLSWQIEFVPEDERLEAAGERLERRGIEPDGDGWSGVIRKEFKKRFPKLVGELHDDSESSTCVLWVESEKACKALVETIWGMVFKK